MGNLKLSRHYKVISKLLKFPFPPTHALLPSHFTSAPNLTAHLIHDTSAWKPGMWDLACPYKCSSTSWELPRLLSAAYSPTVLIPKVILREAALCQYGHEAKADWVCFFPSVHICPERVLACISLSSGKNSNKAVQDPRFLFMERLVTVKAVFIHVLNETKVIW